MGDKDVSHDHPAVSSPASDSSEKAASTAEESVKRPPEQFHDRQLELLRQSLSAEGEGAYQRWGLSLFHSLHDDEAERQRETLGLQPKDALDHYNRGCLLAGREDFAGAARAFDRAAQLDARLTEAFYNRALAQEKAGEVAAAKSSWQAYLERFGDSDDVSDVRQHLESLAQG